MSEETQNDNENEAEDAAEDDPWAAAMQEQTDAEAVQEDGAAAVAQDASAVAAQEPEEQPASHDLEQLSAGGALIAGSDVNMDVILDVPLTISMEIGRTKITIRNLLQLNQGSVVELDRMAGEHLDVMVNGTLIAHGEVVVANEKFGIRLTDVISPVERIKNLRA